MSQIRYFWEDILVGEVREIGTVTPTREEIIAFADQFDPQPFHLDEEAARASVFGGLCASGWHTCSMAMRLMVNNFLQHSASMGSPGLDNIRWLKPVFPGDTLRLQTLCLQSRPMSKRPDVGLSLIRWEMFNQHGEQVLQLEGWSMFRRRTPAS